MTQTTLTTKKVATIGEEIGVELGTQMVKGYQQANPSDVHRYLIGRDIIDQILAQPGCVGIKFYNAINEIGEKTLVYVGVNLDGKSIIRTAIINQLGCLDSLPGIVADRIKTAGDSGSRSRTSIDEDDIWAFD